MRGTDAAEVLQIGVEHFCIRRAFLGSADEVSARQGTDAALGHHDVAVAVGINDAAPYVCAATNLGGLWWRSAFF